MKKLALLCTLLSCLLSIETFAQYDVERKTPKEWENLSYGGRFRDRFLPIPVIGELSNDTWGAGEVVPRYTDNGIEDNEWSYWGGNVKLGDDGKYHLFVCRWPENSPKGHMQWPESEVVHATSNNPLGPFKVEKKIGTGHNPEIFRLADGRYVLYVIGKYYIADSLNGIWKIGNFEFNRRGRKIIEGLTNLTFAPREDGSYLMVCRGGGIWFSKTGISPYNQISDKRVYPDIVGNFEDPVVWRTDIQYHLIVNDWAGRIAYYLRSKNGVNWKVEPGQAYTPGIVKYKDGTVVDWYKYERIKMLQDKYGRATHAYFAVSDTIKRQDKCCDNHSSKNICIPLTVGKRITILDQKKIHKKTKTIRIRIEAEADFNPQTDIDINSLRFGAPEEVNWGRGSKVLKTEKSGNALIVIFNGNENGLTDDNFTAKLLGKTSTGKLLFGYARLPWLNYMEPLLSALPPVFTRQKKGMGIKVEIQNFGEVASKVSKIKIVIDENGEENKIATGVIPPLKPFEKIVLKLYSKKHFEKRTPYTINTSIKSKNIIEVELKQVITILE